MKAMIESVQQMLEKLFLLRAAEQPAVFTEAGVRAARMLMLAAVLLLLILLAQSIVFLVQRKTRAAIACGVTCLVLLAVNVLIYLPHRVASATAISSITVRAISADAMRAEAEAAEKKSDTDKKDTDSSAAQSASGTGSENAAGSGSVAGADSATGAEGAQAFSVAQQADAAAGGAQSLPTHATDATTVSGETEQQSGASTEGSVFDTAPALELSTAQMQTVAEIFAKQICMRTPFRSLAPADGYLVTVALADETSYRVFISEKGAYRLNGTVDGSILCYVLSGAQLKEQVAAVFG